MTSYSDKHRSSSPRPDFYRAGWQDLCGEWEFDFDPSNHMGGDARFLHGAFRHSILVPFPYQSEASGIGDPGFYPCVWYRRSFDLEPSWQGKRILLHFGAVDGDCKIWINDTLVGSHSGGYDDFVFDITASVKPGGNHLLVKVVDDLSPERPRGKQSFASPFAVWYTPMSGIWQPVWLEAVGDAFIEALTIEEADPGSGVLTITVEVDRPTDGATIELVVGSEGEEVQRASRQADYPASRLTVRVPSARPWSPDSPVLYDISLRLARGGTPLDEVDSYVGFRTVSLSEKSFLLNGTAAFLRLVLDQGYWPRTLYSPPTGEALHDDIRLAQSMGFNGCRKHIKPEDPRMLYWADRLGYLVWAEFPAFYADTEKSRFALLRQWPRIVARDRNHPSVVGWLLYNESWGIPGVSRDDEVRDWLRSLVRLTRTLDPSRPLIDNDGWEHVSTDLLSYHTYAPDGKTLKAHHRAYLDGDAPKGRRLMADGPVPGSIPLLLSEFGGVGFKAGDATEKDWGYGGVPATKELYVSRLRDLFRAVYEIEGLAGFCYTQLTDVEIEINGLLDASHRPKLPVELLHSIITNRQ